jgi:serine/threonine protein kinase
MTKNRKQQRKVFKHDIQLANLISNLVQLDPESRLSAKDALKHEFLLDDNNGQKKLNMNFPLFLAFIA